MLAAPFATLMERISVLEKAQMGGAGLGVINSCRIGLLNADSNHNNGEWDSDGEDMVDEWVERAVLEMWGMVRAMIHPSPAARPACEQLLASPLFAHWRGVE